MPRLTCLYHQATAVPAAHALAAANKSTNILFREQERVLLFSTTRILFLGLRDDNLRDLETWALDVKGWSVLISVDRWWENGIRWNWVLMYLPTVKWRDHPTHSSMEFLPCCEKLWDVMLLVPPPNLLSPRSWYTQQSMAIRKATQHQIRSSTAYPNHTYYNISLVTSAITFYLALHETYSPAHLIPFFDISNQQTGSKTPSTLVRDVITYLPHWTGTNQVGCRFHIFSSRYY